MLKKYNFEWYNKEQDEPMVLFGCYGIATKRDVMNHTGLCVIVWSGSDSLRLCEETNFVRYLLANTDRIYHIAHSHWIQTDLDHWNIPYIDRVVLPLDLSGFKFEEQPGSKVYHYGAAQKNREFYYGTHLIRKIKSKWQGNRRYPDITITTHNAYNQAELYQIYKDSFIGVRLTEHDNMALSCIEMGLMGRRSIFNGNIPCAINYGPQYFEYDRAVRAGWVFQDESLRPTIERMILDNQDYPNRLVADEMRDFVHDDEKWLDTKFYD